MKVLINRLNAVLADESVALVTRSVVETEFDWLPEYKTKELADLRREEDEFLDNQGRPATWVDKGKIVRVPVAEAMQLFNAALPVLSDSVKWISDYVALAGARGLLIGAALGAVVAGVRVLLGFDQPYLDR